MAMAVMVGVFAALGMGWFARSELAFHRRAKHDRSTTEPRPLVRVLTSDEELRDAIERAVRFEERAALATSARIERYREAGHLAPVVSLPHDPFGERDSA